MEDAVTLSLRIVSLTVRARPLKPGDFGLVGMATAVTSVLNLFRDAGLSAPTIQRANINRRASLDAVLRA